MSKSTVPVKWAQVKGVLFITLDTIEVKEDSLDVQLSETQLIVSGEANDNKFETVIEFYGEVKPATLKQSVRGKQTEITVEMKERDSWPRLLKGTEKFTWLKVDWSRWVDSDEESEDEGLGGGPGGFGFPPQGFGGFDGGDEDDDEDEEGDAGIQIVGDEEQADE